MAVKTRGVPRLKTVHPGWGDDVPGRSAHPEQGVETPRNLPSSGDPPQAPPGSTLRASSKRENRRESTLSGQLSRRFFFFRGVYDQRRDDPRSRNPRSRNRRSSRRLRPRARLVLRARLASRRLDRPRCRHRPHGDPRRHPRPRRGRVPARPGGLCRPRVERRGCATRHAGRRDRLLARRTTAPADRRRGSEPFPPARRHRRR